MTELHRKPGRKKGRTSANGVKLLIASASIAATLGGWVRLSRGTQEAAVADAAVPEVAAPASAARLELGPIPTVVPPQAFVLQQPAQAQPPQQSAQAQAPQTQSSQQSAQAPTARSTTRPRFSRAPAATTRSSR